MLHVEINSHGFPFDARHANDHVIPHNITVESELHEWPRKD